MTAMHGVRPVGDPGARSVMERLRARRQRRPHLALPAVRDGPPRVDGEPARRARRRAGLVGRPARALGQRACVLSRSTARTPPWPGCSPRRRRDAAEAAEYRRLMEAELRTQKDGRGEGSCWTRCRRRWARRTRRYASRWWPSGAWLRTLNAMRLVLGARLEHRRRRGRRGGRRPRPRRRPRPPSPTCTTGSDTSRACSSTPSPTERSAGRCQRRSGGGSGGGAALRPTADQRDTRPITGIPVPSIGQTGQ